METDFSTRAEALASITCPECGGGVDDVEMIALGTECLTRQPRIHSYAPKEETERRYFVDFEFGEVCDGGNETLSSYLHCQRCEHEWGYYTEIAMIGAGDVRRLLDVLRALSGYEELVKRLEASLSWK